MIAWLESAAAVVLTFGLVIFLHELGHFILCRWYGVRVERFAFGFGPELIGLTHEGTRYSVCALPLGGFVKPAGDNLEDCTGDPTEYFSKPWRHRLAIVAAGPFMNYFLAFLLFSGVILARGTPEASQEPVIGELASGYPADAAGLRVDDRVVRAQGREIATWQEMADIIHAGTGKSIALDVLRAGAAVRAVVVPRKDPASGNGVIGIMPKIDYRSVTVLEAAREGLDQCWLWTAYTVRTLAQKIYRRERPDLAGPVGIVQMVHKAAHSSMEDLIFLIGLLSIAVGFFNILPIPLLDGGHAVLYAWEGVSRKKLTLNAMTAANSMGMVFLLSLLLFATYNDLMRIRAEHREKAVSQMQAKPQ